MRLELAEKLEMQQPRDVEREEVWGSWRLRSRRA